VRIFRFDASFYFANADFFRDQVDALLVQRERAPIRALVLDASGINDLDASAVAALSDIHERLVRDDIELFLACVKGPVRDVLARGHFTDALGPDRFFLDVHSAVEAARQVPLLRDPNPRAA